MPKLFIISLLVCASIWISTAGKAAAQETINQNASVSDVIVATSAQDSGYTINPDEITHPAIKMTPDASVIIPLDREAASIIIGNPNHLSILADSSKRLVLVPKLPGATEFTILDKDGKVIMQRHAIIASPKQQYVRVRRACASVEKGECEETSVFYCPDTCHKVILPTGEEKEQKAMLDNKAIQNQSAAIDETGETDVE
ncbi:MAG: pilus assembly protein N-terminal domain-containing protein [Alphaproteobacteria bacterium]|nr:pilus assembly protein N-terminal domain-containing protein [Alphaproteobacteria bacterium]